MAKKIKFLVDTNIWLEGLLDQDKALEVKEFLNQVSTDIINISDFSLHSIGVIMDKLNKIDYLTRFIDDLFINGNILQLGLKPNEVKKIVGVINKYGLDFDDSYQYIVADKYKLEIVTFDQDFIKAGIRTYTPNNAIKLLRDTKEIT